MKIGMTGLLIEPVWNRNLGILRQNSVSSELLIAPVWNRNALI